MSNANIRLRVLPKIPPIDGRPVEMQVTDTFIQWRLTGDPTWIDLIALSELQGPPGASVEIQSNGSFIQYRVVGTPDWIDIVSLDDLRGPPGFAATVAVGTVTTVDAGDPATVTNSGTSSAAILDFEIPEGPAGPGVTDGDKGGIVVTGSGATWRLKDGDYGDSVVSGGGTVIRNKEFPIPQGRCTLTTGQPVQTADITAATTIYFTPFNGNRAPIYDGVSSFSAYEFSELSLALSTTFHPANTNYELYLVEVGGNLVLGSGPAWAGDNFRGTGAASAEIETVKGIKVNKNAITVRTTGGTVAVPARKGTVVGWFRTSANGQTEFTIAPTAASGGTNNKLFLGNAYNKQPVLALERDSAVNWSLATATTRAANNSNSNRISFILGDVGVTNLPLDVVEAEYINSVNISNAGAIPGIAIGLDSTTVAASNVSILIGSTSTSGAGGSVLAKYVGTPGIGLHYLQALDTSLVAVGGGFNGNPYSRLMACLLL